MAHNDITESLAALRMNFLGQGSNRSWDLKRKENTGLQPQFSEKARRHVQNLRSHCGWKKAHLQGRSRLEVQTSYRIYIHKNQSNLPFSTHSNSTTFKNRFAFPACIWGGKRHTCSSQDQLNKPAHQEASTWRCHRSGPWQLQTSGLPWAD